MIETFEARSIRIHLTKGYVSFDFSNFWDYLLNSLFISLHFFGNSIEWDIVLVDFNFRGIF